MTRIVVGFLAILLASGPAAQAQALWVGHGSTPQGDYLRGVGAAAFGLGVYNLDKKPLQEVAARIGPSPEELATPLAPDEYPEYLGLAFRKTGTYA